MTTDDQLFGAAMTSSWAITEYLMDKQGACPEDLKRAKRRYDGRMARCAKRFGFASADAMRQALRERAERLSQ